jgi:type I restriction enzyme, R subunit
MKERKARNALRRVLGNHYERFDELFDLIKARDEYR